MHCYGAWTNVAEMLDQVETVKLQQLCRYMYQIGVPRILSRFRFRTEYFFLTSDSKLLKYNIDRNCCEETEKIDLLELHVIVDTDLLSFSNSFQ